ncbi:Bactericidal permeability-increasing protein [Holothuria leucospilota]|uniref:Bactericidal permeability-increasing protein n=1 Tax=Holothuria leucospilota TaxID=206669 RepID=A0A9Q1CBV3_HOLLE|nr:Bactericidal permeability-increasing protein [Holothuria leucospilota]
MLSARITLLVVSMAMATVAIQPGFKSRITQRGLDFLRDIGMTELKSKVSSLTIPDQSGSAHIHHIGHIDYDLKNMRITSFNIPTSAITPKPEVGVTISFQGASLSLHGDFHYKYKFIKDHGSFDVTVSEISTSFSIHVGVDESGRPTVSSSSTDCSFNAGKVSVKLHHGASWFYNLFRDQIAHELQKAINKEVCDMIVKEINGDLSEEVAKLKVVIPLKDVAEIDYSLVAAPIFDSSINTAHKGEVYAIGKHTEAPLPIPAIPSDPDVSRMFYMWMTDYVANSAGYVLHNTGFLRYNVTQKDLPSGGKISLNTSEFPTSSFLPQVTKLYPGMMMKLILNTTAPPAIATNSDKVIATMQGDIAAYVIQSDQNLIYLFTLGVDLSLSVTFGVNQSNLIWNSTYESSDLTLVNSAVKGIQVDNLKTVLPLAMKFYLIPQLNEKGKTGVPLPNVKGYKFTNPSITQGQGFIKISTDLSHQPQASNKLRFTKYERGE